MTKRKISATVNPEWLDEATALTGETNVSSVIDKALKTLIDVELERRWLAAHIETDLPGEVVPDLSTIPWDD